LHSVAGNRAGTFMETRLRVRDVQVLIATSLQCLPSLTNTQSGRKYRPELPAMSDGIATLVERFLGPLVLAVAGMRFTMLPTPELILN